jgi:hypothetical protein
VKIQIGRIDSDLEVARKEQRRGFNRRLSPIPADFLKRRKEGFSPQRKRERREDRTEKKF